MKGDPSRALEAAFSRIERENMDGVALLNKALRVESVGFSRWNEGWLGIVVSPWFVNAVFVPHEADGDGRDDEPVFHELPAGTFAFLRARDPEVGRYQTCALSTRMEAFRTHEEALEFARTALGLLHSAPEPVAPRVAPRTPAAVSKRRFLLLRP